MGWVTLHEHSDVTPIVSSHMLTSTAKYTVSASLADYMPLYDKSSVRIEVGKPHGYTLR